MSKPIVLDLKQAAFLDSLVAGGRYASTDEAVMEGLRLLHERETRVGELCDAWREGIESSEYEPLEPFLDDLSAHTQRGPTPAVEIDRHLAEGADRSQGDRGVHRCGQSEA